MAKSERQLRIRAVDDLRDMADAIEHAADLFEDALGDLDRASSNGGVKRSGKNATYEEMAERAKVYGLLLHSKARADADAHLGDTDAHDPATCIVCQSRQSNPSKGWLTTYTQKFLRKEIRAMLAEGDADLLALFDQASEEHIRADERRWLRDHGRLREEET